LAGSFFFLILQKLQKRAMVSNKRHRAL